MRDIVCVILGESRRNGGEAMGEKRTSSQKSKEQSVATAWQVSRIEAVLYHLAIRPGCIGTRGPCAPCSHTPFLSPQPRFITHVQPGTQKPRTTFSTLQPCVSSLPSSSYPAGVTLSLHAPYTVLYRFLTKSFLCLGTFSIPLSVLMDELDISGYCRTTVTMTQELDCSCICEVSKLTVSTLLAC